MLCLWDFSEAWAVLHVSICLGHRDKENLGFDWNLDFFFFFFPSTLSRVKDKVAMFLGHRFLIPNISSEGTDL